VKKAITHLKLSDGNAGKLAQLDAVAVEYLRVVQADIDWLIAHEVKEPDKYADLPDLTTPLSARWQRCAWQQACGTVQSWYANERTNPPVLHGSCIQGNANVIVLEPSETPRFDFWLRISTLNAGAPVRIPLKFYSKARQAIADFPKLCTGVTLTKRSDQWYATLVVERKTAKPATTTVVGVDIGMKRIVATSEGKSYGEVSAALRHRTERATAKRRRKQKLNRCLKRKGKPEVDLSDHKAQAFARNEIGRALNTLLDDLPPAAAVALERLAVKDMRFKSRMMNRWLSAAQLGYTRDKLKFKLDERGIRYRSVQPAYTSQQCSRCGYVDPQNRPSQARFKCLACGFESNADWNASLNIAERFGDDELNRLPFCAVKSLLEQRFQARLPVPRSGTAEPGSAPAMAATAINGQPVQLTPMNGCL